MSIDNRGRPPAHHEGRVEHKPSRPYENKSDEVQRQTKERVNESLKRK